MINFLISCCFEFKCIIPNMKNIFKNTEHLENQSRAMGSFPSILAYIDKLTITCLVAGSREVLFHKESCHDCEVLESQGKHGILDMDLAVHIVIPMHSTEQVAWGYKTSKPKLLYYRLYNLHSYHHHLVAKCSNTPMRNRYYSTHYRDL